MEYADVASGLSVAELLMCICLPAGVPGDALMDELVVRVRLQSAEWCHAVLIALLYMKDELAMACGSEEPQPDGGQCTIGVSADKQRSGLGTTAQQALLAPSPKRFNHIKLATTLILSCCMVSQGYAVEVDLSYART